MKRLSFILALVLVSFFFEIRSATALVYTPPDSCLKYITEWYKGDSLFTMHSGLSNPDSILVDSCISNPTSDDAYVTGESYLIYFRYNIIPRNYLAPADTLIEYTISDILPQYSNAISEFQKIENDYGTVKFREIYPNNPDTLNYYGTRYLAVYFKGMIPIYKVEKILDSTSIVYRIDNLMKHLVFVTNVEENLYNNKIYIYVENDILKITNNNIEKNNEISIYDIQGVLVDVYQYDGNNINISSLCTGIYFAKINGKFYKFSIIK